MESDATEAREREGEVAVRRDPLFPEAGVVFVVSITISLWNESRGESLATLIGADFCGWFTIMYEVVYRAVNKSANNLAVILSTTHSLDQTF